MINNMNHIFHVLLNHQLKHKSSIISLRPLLHWFPWLPRPDGGSGREVNDGGRKRESDVSVAVWMLDMLTELFINIDNVYLSL